MGNISTGIDTELERGLSEGLRPTEVGIAAHDQAGYHASKFFHQAGEAAQAVANDIQQHETQVQAAKTITDETSAYDNIDQGVAHVIASNTDPTKLHDEVQNYFQGDGREIVDSIGASATTPQARAHAVEARQRANMYMVRTGSGDVSHAVGDYTITSITAAANGITQRMESGQIPLADGHAQIDKLIHDTVVSAVGLSPDDAAKVKDGLALKLHQQGDNAAFLGLARRNPLMAGEAMGRGDFKFISGDDRARLENAAISDAHQAVAEERQQRELASQDKQNQYLAAIGTQVGPTTTPEQRGRIRTTILTDPTLLPSAKTELVSMADRASKPEEFHADPAVVQSLTARAMKPDTDPDHLTDSELIGHTYKDISKEQFEFIHQVLHPKDPSDVVGKTLMTQALAQARSVLIPSDPFGTLGTKTPAEEAAYSKFLGWFMPTYTQAVKGGQTPAALLNPASPHYILGKGNAFIAHFSSGPQTAEDGFQAQAAANARASGQPLPGAKAGRPSLDDIARSTLGGK